MKDKFKINLELDKNDIEDVNQLLDLIIEDAINKKASDIHLNPGKNGLKVRYRVDGVLHDIKILSPLIYNPLLKSIKERFSMDIETNLKPQDGKISWEIKNQYLDIRVSTLPSFFGENIVMRILNKSTVMLTLENLGFSEENLKNYKKILNSPKGLIIVTGPTGSGKTTTVYSSLQELNNSKINIMTVEDPVEYIIENTIQTPINVKEGITFPVTLRSMFRQDPDVIYCGEVRDDETTKLLIQAALTGHVTITSLHADEPLEALMRLIDLGIESFLVYSAAIGVLSQKLIRTICPDCKESLPLNENFIKLLKEEHINTENQIIYRGKGCNKCHFTGYRGRTAIHEILVIDDDLRNKLNSKSDYTDIKRIIREKGFPSMRHDGLKKALEGITTIDEVLRVTSSKGCW